MSQNEEKTTREKLIEIFLNNPGVEFTLNELLLRLNLKERDAKQLLNNINHVAKSIKRLTGGKAYLAMRPPTCLDCGYIFRDLESARMPSKCPRCKSERIIPPSFILLRKE
ncbi:hypothetical protein MA03_05720 [Infirmifilum uzonense]|uniref:PF0610-like rubredoxin-like zinc beta-ribbon C-terminal domain-containing protein n=1 Tax=Infirmifilum uzonense TaxID=1550241 RepID=A0A0F7FI54_9CREN|nr:hypothetical protein [Infirmifilum uzonense]AKG38860.1 hypothetical protein MA03_05720 [Infirmifilum uzonense]